MNGLTLASTWSIEAGAAKAPSGVYESPTSELSAGACRASTQGVARGAAPGARREDARGLDPAGLTEVRRGAEVLDGGGELRDRGRVVERELRGRSLRRRAAQRLDRPRE